VGYRAEFFEPLELEVRGGALACAGTFSFSVLRLESLGNSNASRFSLSDDCERLMPYLRSLTGWTGKSSVRPPRHAEPEQVPRELTVADLLLGLRAEVSGNGTELAVRGWYVFPVFQGLGDPGALTLHLSGARLTGSAPGFGSEIALGAGLNLFGLAELVASGGVRLGFDGFPTELMGAIIGRVGFPGAGFDFRAQWTSAGPVLFFGVDVAPFYLVGSAL